MQLPIHLVNSDDDACSMGDRTVLRGLDAKYIGYMEEIYNISIRRLEGHRGLFSDGDGFEL